MESNGNSGGGRETHMTEAARRIGNLELQRATVADLPLIAAMEQDADTRELIIPYAWDVHVRKLSDPGFVYLRVLEGGRVVGFMILVLDADGTSVELRRVVISPKGRGVGQSAIPLVERYCREQLGRTRIWLDVFAQNHRAFHVYAKHAYRVFAERTHGDRLLLLLEKRLSGPRG